MKWLAACLDGLVVKGKALICVEWKDTRRLSGRCAITREAVLHGRALVCVMSRMYNVLISVAGNAKCDGFEMGPWQSGLGADPPRQLPLHTPLASLWPTDIIFRSELINIAWSKKTSVWVGSFWAGKGGWFDTYLLGLSCNPSLLSSWNTPNLSLGRANTHRARHGARKQRPAQPLDILLLGRRGADRGCKPAGHGRRASHHVSSQKLDYILW